MRTHRILAAALAALALGGCSLLSRLARSAFEPPTLEYQSWSPESLDAEGVTIALHYRLTNPNDHGFKLSRAGWALALEGKPAASGDMPSGLAVPAKGTVPFDLPVRVRWRDVPDLVKLAATRSDVAFKVTGTAALASPLGDVDVPFSREGRLDIPSLPRFSIAGIRVRELSLSNVSIDVHLRIANGNKFPLPIGALAYGLRLGDEDVAKGDALPLAAVPPGGDVTVRIPVRLSLAGAAAAMKRLLDGDAVPVEVQGNAGFGDLVFPFAVEGVAPSAERPALSGGGRPSR